MLSPIKSKKNNNYLIGISITLEERAIKKRSKELMPKIRQIRFKEITLHLLQGEIEKIPIEHFDSLMNIFYFGVHQ